MAKVGDLGWTLLGGLGPLLAAGIVQGGRMDQPESATIEAGVAGQWAVTVQRTIDGRSGCGRVVVRSARHPDAARPPHTELAGARAWLALGRAAAATKSWPLAATAAEKGLAELGSDYAPAKVDDSTDLKIKAARELLAHAQAENGARLLLDMLAARAALYVGRHHETVVE